MGPFTEQEHRALRRLFDVSTGDGTASRQIAFWFQQWELAPDKSSLARSVLGVTPSQADDVLVVASAAIRELVSVTDLGQPEYVAQFLRATLAHPLPPSEQPVGWRLRGDLASVRLSPWAARTWRQWISPRAAA